MIQKKQNIHFLKISILLTVLFLGLAAHAQSNPFLSKNKIRQNPYAQDKQSVLIVFDASSSMEDKIHSETKIHIAKRVLEDVLTKIDRGINLGLRAYGLNTPTGNPYIDCTDSKLLVLPGTNNRRVIVSEAYKVLPRGLTPITYSLAEAVKDLIPYKGEKSIILISDGLETCGGDPCRLASDLIASNVDLKIDVVGFGVRDNWAAQEQLMCIALNTKGKYFSADNAEELTQGLSESINKSVSGRIITMIGKPVEVKSEETAGYENFPKLKPEKLILKK